MWEREARNSLDPIASQGNRSPLRLKSFPVFLNDPERISRILAMAKAPLRDAAAVNATRWALLHVLQSFALPIETASGGRTKYNRQRLDRDCPAQPLSRIGKLCAAFLNCQ